jgi:hypothetical protein
MLKVSKVQFAHAYDLLRRATVSAIDALRRGLHGIYFADHTRRERLVLVRSRERMPHFRRLPVRNPCRQRPLLPAGLVRTPHQRAIRRLQLELTTGEGLRCAFHDGFSVRPEQLELVRPGQPVVVDVERSRVVGGHRIVPDMLIRCATTNVPLLAIEVCASHPVGERKRLLYSRAAITWIEVRALHTSSRFRKMPVCAQDWSGSLLPTEPLQLTFKFGNIALPAGPQDAHQRQLNLVQ